MFCKDQMEFEVYFANTGWDAKNNNLFEFCYIRTGRDLKVPKHEIFDGVFFASKEPIWFRDS